MGVNVASLIVKLQADTTSAEANLAKFNGTFGLMGAAVVGGAAAIGIAALTMAGNFQSGLTSLVTGAGEAQSNLGLVSSGIKQLSVDSGTSTQDLISGMYLIESAGYHGKAGLDVLKAAAEGAKVGNASLADVANGVTTVMTDYANTNITATQSTNMLVETVSLGKTHMSDLSQAMATVLPAASAVGVKLSSVGGAMATMTAEGEPAADAATHLKQMLLSLENPSAKAKKELGDIGLTSSQVADEMKVSLPGTIQLIQDHLGKKFPVGSAAYNAALASVVGGNKQLQAALELSGQHLGTFQQNTKDVAGTVDGGGKSIKGWSLVQQDFNFKMDQAKQATGNLMLSLGQALLPTATKLATFLTGTLIPGIQHIAQWFQNGSAQANAAKVALAVLGIVIAGALVAAFVSWAAAAAAAAVATIAATWPVLAIGAGIALLIAGIILLVKHWNDVVAVLGVVKKWIGDVAGVIGGFISGALGKLKDGIGLVMGKLNDFWGLLGSIKNFLVNDITSAVNGITTVFKNVFGGLEAIVKAPINLVINALNTLIGGLDLIHFSVPSWVPVIGGKGFGFDIAKIPQLASGTESAAGGLSLVGEKGPELVYLPKGVGVLPADKTTSLLHASSVSGLPAGMTPSYGMASGSANGQPLVVNLWVDRTKLGQVVAQVAPAAIRHGTGQRAM